jgi:hypothetical protein
MKRPPRSVVIIRSEPAVGGMCASGELRADLVGKQLKLAAAV